MEEQKPAIPTVPGLPKTGTTETPVVEENVNVKKWWESKFLLGGLILVVIVLVGFVGYGALRFLIPVESGKANTTHPPIASDENNIDDVAEDPNSDSPEVEDAPKGGSSGLRTDDDAINLEGYQELESDLGEWKRYVRTDLEVYSLDSDLEYEDRSDLTAFTYIYVRKVDGRRVQFSVHEYIPEVGIADAVVRAVEGLPTDYFQNKYYVVGGEGKVMDEWAGYSLSKVYYKDQNIDYAEMDFRNVLVRKDGEGWRASILGTPSFSTFVTSAPLSFLSEVSKDELLLMNQSYEK